ncbi:Hypothetical protein C900_04534 [Fulvivirga imtechensis AK7]|uniref:DUF86 domain-containing protein n=1 Tax=Fulvivirga imtechensis AK7 TaxID=1237149 RepID=L8JLM6_9BACT|nr:DUF86 domain-containing protein [Fulvivirga imtechensis]ELR69831.1 Hypothetical protein C900_04534 [Fulvivirga imtechensis AK7]
MASRRYDFYLKDMLVSRNRIEGYVHDMSFDQFEKNYLIVDAVVRNFEITGEASKNIPKEIKAKYPQMPREQMYGLKNIVIHEYFGVDHHRLWTIDTSDLPANKKDLRERLKIKDII